MDGCKDPAGYTLIFVCGSYELSFMSLYSTAQGVVVLFVFCLFCFFCYFVVFVFYLFGLFFFYLANVDENINEISNTN